MAIEIPARGHGQSVTQEWRWGRETFGREPGAHQELYGVANAPFFFIFICRVVTLNRPQVQQSPFRIRLVILRPCSIRFAHKFNADGGRNPMDASLIASSCSTNQIKNDVRFIEPETVNFTSNRASIRLTI